MRTYWDVICTYFRTFYPALLKNKDIENSETIDIIGKNILRGVFCTHFACEHF